MEINRLLLIGQIQKMVDGEISREEIGWWAYDLMLEEELNYEPGYEKLLGDVLRSLHYFYDDEPLMQQFHPDSTEILYYLSCLKGEQIYQRSRVIHWKV